MAYPRPDNSHGGTSLVVIPALAPPPELLPYVQSLLAVGFRRIIIVDDGSGPRSREIFQALEQTDGCTVLTHEVNRGKGAALKTALRYCLEMNGQGRYHTAIMVDADGQHTVDDVCCMATESHQHPDSYVLGVRDFNQEVVPARSRFGNRLTSGGFHLLYGRYLRDTQTGLRAVPSGLWEWALGIPGDRFEYETNCLVQAVKHGIPMAEVPIQTVYFNRNAGTHYRALWDSWPILLVLLRNMGAYALSGVLSAVIGLIAFYYVDQVVLTPWAPAGRILAASLAASAVSSLARLLLHRTLALRTERNVHYATGRYYGLLSLQMLASYLIVLGVHVALDWPAVWIKIVADIVLALVGYQIHPRWLFRAR